jgi:hypothetical protein
LYQRLMTLVRSEGGDDVCNFNTLFRWVKTLGAVCGYGCFSGWCAPRIGSLE